MKKGFTLLELLIASLLLSMLVTILTQLFSQSSIAWRTGEAGVAELDQMRADISAIQRDADNAVFVTSKSGAKTRRLEGVWVRDSSGNEKLNDKRGYLENPAWESQSFPSDPAANPLDIKQIKVSNQGSGVKKVKHYLVGVTSAGPDGKFDTWDDITSWPTDE